MTAPPAQTEPLDRRRRFQPSLAIAFGQLQDWFLIAAVTTILLIRLQLKLTNYPKLGGGTLHIGHILWGGLLMVVAIGVLVTVLDRRWRLPAAIVGGAGFGFFIDEVGKFVTSNNDYFFKPSAAIIYFSFIVLYLVTRWLRGRRGFTSSEYVANALDVFGEATAHDFTEREKQQTLNLLDRAEENQLAASLRGLVENTPTVPIGAPTRLDRLTASVRRRYAIITESRWFRRIVVGIIVLLAAFDAVELITVGLWALGVDLPVNWHFTFAQAGETISGLVALALVYAGIARLIAHRRLDAYHLFEYALLVNLFVSQMFAYIDRSFVATWDFLFTLAMLIGVRILIRQEVRRRLWPTVGATPAQAPPVTDKRPSFLPRFRARIRTH